MIGVKSSTALRMNSRCTWRPREGARNVYNTAIRRALSPLRPYGSVPADVHGGPRGVAPIRHPIAIRDTPVAHTGGETTQSPHHSTGCAARPSILFSPPGHGFSTLDARWKLLDIIGFKRCQRSSANRKLAAGDDKQHGDCASRKQSPSLDPRCLLW